MTHEEKNMKYTVPKPIVLLMLLVGLLLASVIWIALPTKTAAQNTPTDTPGPLDVVGDDEDGWWNRQGEEETVVPLKPTATPTPEPTEETPEPTEETPEPTEETPEPTEETPETEPEVIPTNTPRPVIPTNTPRPVIPTNTPRPVIPTNTPIPTDTPIPPTPTTPPAVAVPNVVGMDSGSAESTIRGARLVPNTTFGGSNCNPFYVVSQNPASGTTLSPGSSVIIQVCPQVVVPNVIGMDKNAASGALSNVGLDVSVVGSCDGTKPDGQVWATEPGPGSTVSPGITVTVYFYEGCSNEGPPTIISLPVPVPKDPYLTSAEHNYRSSHE
jgi:outer membrane biosynthesis protein TonB